MLESVGDESEGEIEIKNSDEKLNNVISQVRPQAQIPNSKKREQHKENFYQGKVGNVNKAQASREKLNVGEISPIKHHSSKRDPQIKESSSNSNVARHKINANSKNPINQNNHNTQNTQNNLPVNANYPNNHHSNYSKHQNFQSNYPITLIKIK